VVRSWRREETNHDGPDLRGTCAGASGKNGVAGTGGPADDGVDGTVVFGYGASPREGICGEWEAIGARFERACTLLLLPEHAEEGARELIAVTMASQKSLPGHLKVRHLV
jgi:hypothetical protein